MKKYIVPIVLIAMLTACGVRKQKENTSNANNIIEANNAFGFDLINKVDAQFANDNWMISPTSISMAFAMLYNGAEKETKAQIEEVLKLKGMSLDEINEAYLAFNKLLTSADAKVTFNVANSIWIREQFEVLPDFIETNQRYFNALVQNVDFRDAATVWSMNQWISDKTAGKIPTIIESIPDDAVMYLLNALYFKGDWTTEFKASKTSQMQFDLLNGKQESVSTMMRLDSALYFKNETFAAVQLPYGNGDFAMNILLPNDGKSASDILQLFNNESYTTLNNSFEMTERVDLKIPKFKFEFELTLNQLLADMGMKDAFTSTANFSKINEDQSLYISSAKHKTFIEVGEKGTEAAAATIIGMIATSANISEPAKIPFYCNKPFVFTITDQRSNTVLFAGKVANPNI